MDEHGQLLWPYEALDVHGAYIGSLTLVDGSGTEVFPNTWGCEGMGSAWAEFIYPHMEEIPEELWLAPWTADGLDMNLAIRVK